MKSCGKVWVCKLAIYGLIFWIAGTSTVSMAASSSSTSDQSAVALLAKADRHLARIYTLSAHVHRVIRNRTKTRGYVESTWDSDVRLMRPYYMRLDEVVRRLPANKITMRVTDVCTGRKHYFLAGYDGTYVEKSVEYVQCSQHPWLWGFYPKGQSLLAGVKYYRSAGYSATVKALGRRKWRGKSYSVVEIDEHAYLGENVTQTYTAYIESDGTMPFCVERYMHGADCMTVEAEMTDIVANRPVKPADFAYELPAGSKPYEQETFRGLANGTQAPDFTVDGVDGRPVSLKQYRGHVVVLEFWAVWCGNCTQELPYVEKLAEKYRDAGVTVVAIDVGDKKDKFESYVVKHKELNAVTFTLDPTMPSTLAVRYDAGGIPVDYVIGPDGKVLYSEVGWSGNLNELTAAVDKAVTVAK